MKQLFRVVNTLLGKEQQSSLPQRDVSDLAGMFGDFFIEKIDNIAKSIIPGDKLLDVDMPAVSSSLCNFKPVDDGELKRLVLACPNKSCEADPIPTSFVKSCIDQLIPVFSAIINTSLNTGVFPQSLKNALVTPLLKKSSLDCNLLKNYRPISNLAFISKVLEKVVSIQLRSYLVDNNLMEPFQSAYRQGHSTETALVRVHNDIICALGDRRAVLLVLLDLSAAFDTVEHQCLLNTMQQLGIHENALQ